LFLHEIARPPVLATLEVDLLMLDRTPAFDLQQSLVEVHACAVGGGGPAVIEQREEQQVVVAAFAELPPWMVMHTPRTYDRGRTRPAPPRGKRCRRKPSTQCILVVERMPAGGSTQHLYMQLKASAPSNF